MQIPALLRRKRRLLCLAFLAASICTSAFAQDSCKVAASSDAVVIVLCKTSAKQDEWRAAGAAACKDKKPCNAWIWDDAAKAPKAAPAKDTDMPKSQTGTARAVWVSDSQNLIIVRSAK